MMTVSLCVVAYNIVENIATYGHLVKVGGRHEYM